MRPGHHILLDGAAAEGTVRWTLEALGALVTPEAVKVMTPSEALYFGPTEARDLRARLQQLGWLARDVVKVVAPGKTAKKSGLRIVAARKDVTNG